MAPGTRAAIYARVSTLDQEPENQLQELQGMSMPGAGLQPWSTSIMACPVREIAGPPLIACCATPSGGTWIPSSCGGWTAWGAA